MLFKSGKSFVVRIAVLLTLFGGTLGVRNVQASPLETGDPTTVLVVSSSGSPLAGKPVYAFNGSAYTGYSKVTDANGEAAITLPEGSYRFRVDVDGTQFWSGSANHCNNCLSVVVAVPDPVLVAVQNTAGAPASGLNVYAFNGTTYTGFHGITDPSGQVSLRLLEGSYRFRADLNGTQFWSGSANHCDVPGCTSASVTVSKPMTVTVLDTDGEPKPGLNVYAFHGSTYTGYNKTTNTEGQATFTLPLGSYRFRADLNGTQFWSGTSNHCSIPGCDSTSVTVSKPMTVLLLDTDGAPKAGLNIYAFNGNMYTGYSKVSNTNGQAVFTLPPGSYRFRADLNGTQFWSGSLNHCDLPGCDNAQVTVTIPLTVAIQDGGGTPKSGINVYAFNSSTYTGYSKVSDVNGQTVFTLPLGSYRFRADYNGVQYWSDLVNHCTLPGCLSTAVTVGPAIPSTFTPTATATDTPPATYTPTFTHTPTSTVTATDTPLPTPIYTPTITPTTSLTPVMGCDATHVTWSLLQLEGNTMRMSITNNNPYDIVVKDVFVVWNDDRGHRFGSDTTLKLQSVQLPQGNIFWSSDAPWRSGPSFQITPSTTVTIPGNGVTSWIIFTFHQTYIMWDNTEEIYITLSTPGCENFFIRQTRQ